MLLGSVVSLSTIFWGKSLTSRSKNGTYFVSVTMSQQLSNSTYIIHLFINLFCWNQECYRRQNGYWILPRVVHFTLHPQKRDGLLGKGTKEWRLDRGYRPKKAGETVDRRQNNGNVKAVSPRHCPATSALRNFCFNCRAWAESQGQ